VARDRAQARSRVSEALAWPGILIAGRSCGRSPASIRASQLLHEDDAADASSATVRRPRRRLQRAVMVSSMLSQAIDVMGGRPAPILPPYGTLVFEARSEDAAGVDLPAHLADVILRFRHDARDWRRIFFRMAVPATARGRR